MRVLYILILLMSIKLNSQDLNVGLMGGLSLLNGDYPSVRLKDTFTLLANPGYGAFIRRPINEKLAIKGSVYFTRFSGDDRLIPRFIGTHIPSSINRANMEIQLNGEYTAFRLPINSKNEISFYLQSGIVFSKTTVSGNDVNDDCPILNLGIPFGGGGRLPFKEKYFLFAQFEYVQGLNDCFDGFVDLSKTKDVYYSLKIGISTLLAPEVKGVKNIGCPKF